MAPSISTILLGAALVLSKYTNASPTGTKTIDAAVPTVLVGLNGELVNMTKTAGPEPADSFPTSYYGLYSDPNCNSIIKVLGIAKSPNNPYEGVSGPYNPYYTWQSAKYVSGAYRSNVDMCFQGSSCYNTAVIQLGQDGRCYADGGAAFDKFLIMG